MILPQQFRRDFPEFGSEAIYPTPQLNLWLNLANMLLTSVWDDTPGQIGNPGMLAGLNWSGNIATATTPSPHGQVGFFDVLIGGVVPTVFNGDFFATVIDFDAFTYPLPLAASPMPVTTLGTFQLSSNSVRDIGLELFTAHMLTLNKQAMDAAGTGGTPGQNVGPIQSKSISSVSVSFDVAHAIMEGASFWNLSTYGTRFYWLADMMGMGPDQIGIGLDINTILGFNGPPWVGPWPWPSQTGFSS
jgi:hypothetical protein